MVVYKCFNDHTKLELLVSGVVCTPIAHPTMMAATFQIEAGHTATSDVRGEEIVMACCHDQKVTRSTGCPRVDVGGAYPIMSLFGSSSTKLEGRDVINTIQLPQCDQLRQGK